MPYKDKRQDRDWHREYMKRKRKGVTPDTPLAMGDVTPSVTPDTRHYDVDGQPIPDY